MEIELSTYEESESRITRLKHVVGYICALADHYGNEQLMLKIQRLNDHKGILEVLWKANAKVEEGELEIIQRAWSSRIGDGCTGNVEHEFQTVTA